MSNYFEQVADSQLSGAAKAKHRARAKREAKSIVQSDADAPMVGTPQDRQQEENSQLLRQWEKWRREKSDIILEGAHGREYQQLLLLLQSLIPESAPALAGYVQRCEWVAKLSETDRHTIWGVVGEAIIKLRIRLGLPPFDDSLPGELPTAFEQIRHTLTGVGLPCP